MEPTIQQESINSPLYLPFHCWYHTGKPKREFKICGMQSGYYNVFRSDPNRPNSQVIQMWLCGKHKKVVERSGYQVHPATYKSDVHGTMVTMR